MSVRPNGALRIGVDLDNTLVCYDPVFHRLAAEHGMMVGERAPTKENVRQYLRRRGMDNVWTEMQGLAYGAHMIGALPFPGAREFLQTCARGGAEVFVVSHRTRVPIAGPPWDLHRTARQWLTENGMLEHLRTDGPHVFLESTRQGKVRRIDTLGLDYFVDDLLEILVDPDFPLRTVGVHFGPNRAIPAHDRTLWAGSWSEVQHLILEST